MNEKHSGLPVSGDRAQPEEAVATVNASKEIEEHVLRLIDEIGEDETLYADKRWLALGRTQIELGFMAVNRAVFRPDRISLAEEDEPIVETGWVLERADSDPSRPLYYAPEGGHGEMWSHDHNDALRFAREIDASRQAYALGIQVRVCEHEWVS
jgi:hypothetical protein